MRKKVAGGSQVYLRKAFRGTENAPATVFGGSVESIAGRYEMVRVNVRLGLLIADSMLGRPTLKSGVGLFPSYAHSWIV